MFDKELFLSETHKHKSDYLRNFPNSKGFAIDGPNDTEVWNKQDKKILFLLKETYHVEGQVCNCMDSLEYNKSRFYDNKTNQNIAKLAYGLISGKKTVGVSKKKLSHFYSSVATIEIKKSTGLKTSQDSEIRKHALFSKDFIKWQVQHLNPDIVICCGKVVYDFAVKDVFGVDSKESIINIDDAVVVNSYHPSSRDYKVDAVVRACK
jgi:hypothetical protein